jgi:hypothetical protein
MIAKKFILLVSAGVLTLSACGGGGSTGTTFIPPPPITSGPPTVVGIFPNPAPQTFASAGTSTPGAFYLTDKFGPVSSNDADQAHIRYTADGFYEIQLPGRDWRRTLPDADRFLLNQAATQEYSFSKLAQWSVDATRYGSLAFGIPTLAGQVPQSGMATYRGIVSGSSDVGNSNGFDGNYRVPVAGSIDLNFDFAKGALVGSIDLKLDDYSPASIGTFAFKDTIFAAGSTTYSGAFATTASGQNFFLGQFTGPKAEETIGAWAVPFVFTNGSSTLTPDNQTHQAFGAFVAKQ